MTHILCSSHTYFCCGSHTYFCSPHLIPVPCIYCHGSNTCFCDSHLIVVARISVALWLTIASLCNLHMYLVMSVIYLWLYVAFSKWFLNVWGVIPMLFGIVMFGTYYSDEGQDICQWLPMFMIEIPLVMTTIYVRSDSCKWCMTMPSWQYGCDNDIWQSDLDIVVTLRYGSNLDVWPWTWYGSDIDMAVTLWCMTVTPWCMVVSLYDNVIYDNVQWCVWQQYMIWQSDVW